MKIATKVFQEKVKLFIVVKKSRKVVWVGINFRGNPFYRANLFSRKGCKTFSRN